MSFEHRGKLPEYHLALILAQRGYCSVAYRFGAVGKNLVVVDGKGISRPLQWGQAPCGELKENV